MRFDVLYGIYDTVPVVRYIVTYDSSQWSSVLRTLRPARYDIILLNSVLFPNFCFNPP